MTILEFSRKLCDSIQETLGDSVMLSEITNRRNNNVILHGIIIQNREFNISPTIYLDNAYERYKEGETLQSIKQHILEVYEECKCTKSVDLSGYTDFDKVKDRICYKLISFERNIEMLKDIPYIKYLDLAVCFFVPIELEEIGGGVISVLNKHLDYWGVDKETLMEYASINTPKLYPAQIKSMEETIAEMIPKDFAAEEMGSVSYENSGMYVVSNTKKLFGAITGLYPDCLQEFACKQDANFYIIPSSIHELILIRDNGNCNPDELGEMVREVNSSQVEKWDVLSDRIYYYDRELRMFDLV